MTRALARALAPLLLAGIAAACAQRLAPPELEEGATEAHGDAVADEALDLWLERKRRLLTVVSALRTRGAPLCGEDVVPYLGVGTAWARDDEDPLDRALMRRFGAPEDLTTVIVVQPDSPAEAAGVEPGDAIVAANGRRTKYFRDVLAALERDPDAAPQLRLRRGDGEREVSLPRVPACRPVVALGSGDALRFGPSRSRGYRGHGYLTVGLLEFAASDDELAVFAAHELAHRLFGGFEGAYPDDEAEADRLGLRLAAAAGYDVSVAPRAWERLGLERPILIEWVSQPGIRREPPHARIARRIPAMRELVAGIRAEDDPAR